MEEEMRYWRVDMESDLYAGVRETYYVIARDLEQANDLAEELTQDFTNDYSYVHTGWLEDEEDGEDAAELEDEFASEISYRITEVSHEEFEENT